MSLSIIIPIRNEEENIENITKKISKLSIDLELCFIDDFSQDKSFEKVLEVQKEFEFVKVIKNRKKGFQFHKGDVYDHLMSISSKIGHTSVLISMFTLQFLGRTKRQRILPLIITSTQVLWTLRIFEMTVACTMLQVGTCTTHTWARVT